MVVITCKDQPLTRVGAKRRNRRRQLRGAHHVVRFWVSHWRWMILLLIFLNIRTNKHFNDNFTFITRNQFSSSDVVWSLPVFEGDCGCMIEKTIVERTTIEW